jgi:hypothetical protein
MARYWRMKGFDVLHPIGWDSFGLPAEQFAIQTGTQPASTTTANIANFKRQLKSLGFSYDWNREVATTDVEYVKWTQWIFLQVSTHVIVQCCCWVLSCGDVLLFCYFVLCERKYGSILLTHRCVTCLPTNV